MNKTGHDLYDLQHVVKLMIIYFYMLMYDIYCAFNFRAKSIAAINRAHVTKKPEGSPC